MDKCVVITGTSSGLGLETSIHLLEEGYTVIGIDINPQTGISHPRFESVTMDLSCVSLEQTVVEVLSERTLYAMIHCAGVSIGDKVSRLSDKDWSKSIEVNLTSAMRLCRLSSKHMIEGGRILLIGSPVGLVGANKPSYAASKAGLHALTMSVSREVGLRGILVNTILPGPMFSGMTSDWSQEKQNRIASETRIGRLCDPMEVAQLIGFLLSSQCSYMTASIIDMTAGSMFGH